MAGLFHLGSRMADLDITGRVVVDASQAEGAFDRVADKAEQMGREVADAARQAGKEVDGMGDGANTSAEKFTRAEARIRDSIKRSTQELNLLGKTASEKLEFKIADKGLDSSKFTSYIAELKKAEAAQMALGAASVRSGSVASASLDSMGMSANATAAALRGVPAQFTDIITSLQGGQAPLTVFLQQGGQLKDMFGGAGNAARALGGYVVGLINPFTLAAGAVAALGLAYFQGSKEADAYNKAIITTGNAAGTTASQMQQMAQRISSVVGTQGAAAATLAQLAGSSRIAAENFEYFGTVALKVEKTVGTAVAETVKQFAELGKAPVEASKKLNEETNYLTQAIYEQIKALKDQGREAEAAATAQKAYADAINSRSDQMTQNLGLIERAWRGITGAAKGAWDAMLNVGRQDTLQDQIGAIRTRLDAARSERGMTGAFGQTGIDKGIEVLQQRLSLLTEQERLLKRGAESQAARAQAEKAAIEATDALGKANEKALTKQEQMNKALGEYRANLEKVKAVNPNSALLNAAQIAKAEKAIRDQYKDTGAVAAMKKEESAYASLIATIKAKITENEAELQSSVKVSESDKLRIKLMAELESGAKTLTTAHKTQALALIDKLAAQEKEERRIKSMVAAYKQEQEVVEEIAQAYVAQNKAREAGRASVQDYARGIDESNEALQFELSVMGLSEQSRKVAIEQYKIELSLKKQIEAIDKNTGFDAADREEERAKARAAAAIAAASVSAKVATEEWQKTSEEINRTLTDALLRGFESGKDFAKNLRDTVVNMFKTMVLRPIISAIINPISGALTGALGLSGAAQAAGGAGGAGSLLSGASMLGNFGGTFGMGLKSGLSGLLGEAGLSGTISAGTTAIGAGNIAGGLGTLAGPLAILGGGILALTAILKATKGETRTGGQFGVAFDGSVTNQRRDQTYTMAGQQFDRDFTNGLQTALRDGLTYRLEGDPVAQEGAIKAAVSGTASGINGILKALGSEARLAGFSAGLETSGKGRGGVFAGGTFADGRAFGESGKGDNYQGTLYEKFSTNSPDFKAALENFTLDLKQSTIQALQTVTDIPKSVKSLLDGVDAEGLADDAANALLESINAQIVGVDQLKQAFSTIGFDKLADMSFDAATGLAAASGGFDKLIANLDTYYSNFFTAEEQRAQIQKNLQQSFASLDLTLPDIDATDARAQFRALVESASGDLSDTGQKTYAALLQMSGSFAQITPEAAAVVQAVNAISQAMQRLTGDTANLQIELLQAQGRESDALALRREIETQGFNAAEVAAYDYNQSLRASITATNAASAALKAYKTAASSISTSKDTLAGIVRSPVEIAQNALNQTLLRLNETLKPANVVKDDYTYFTLYQDVLDFWKSESGKGGALAGVSAEEYAQIHYESSGKSEGRMSPQEALDLITTLVPNYNPLTLEDVLKLDTSGQGAYSAEQWEVIADVFAKAANVKLAAETPVTPATSVVDTSTAALSDILQERKTLQEQYDNLTMTSTQLLEKQRGALHESNRELFDSIQIEERKAVVASERKGLQDQYDELTLTSAQLLERQRDALDESNRALFDSIQTIKSEAKAREDAVKALGDSYDGVQRAVDAQRKIYQVARDTAQESVSEITSVFDILKSSVRDLYGSVDSTAQMQAVQGRDFIRQALATAQTTGYLPDSKQLTEAINAAKGGTKEFATQFEKDLEALTLASDLSVMERLTKDQLTEAERMLGIADAQLDSLDGILELAKQQLDAANGINTSVLSVKDALSTFAAAIIAAANAAKTVVVPPTGTTTGTGGGGLTVGSTTFASAGDAFGVPLYAVGGGVADADTIAQLIAISSSLPKFADGGMHSGGLRWVGENGPELEATGPSRIWNAQQLRGAMGGGSNNARLEALVEGLTAEVQRLQAIVAQGVTHQRETAEILDNVTEGGNAMRSEVMP